jgi:hypothetical protein
MFPLEDEPWTVQGIRALWIVGHHLACDTVSNCGWMATSNTRLPYMEYPALHCS